MKTGNLKLEVRRPDVEPKQYDIEPGIYSVGSDDDCKIRLSHGDVEDRHAILTIRENEFWIEDLDARSGTCVDGKPVAGRMEVNAGQEIGIGPFILVIEPDSKAAKLSASQSVSIPGAAGTVLPESAGPVPPPAPSGADLSTGLSDVALAKSEASAEVEGSDVEGPALNVVEGSAPSIADAERLKERKENEGTKGKTFDNIVATDPVQSTPEIEQVRSIKLQIHKELVERLDIKRLTASRINKAELQERALKTIQDIVDDVRGRLPGGLDPDALAKEVYDEALGLGPLEEFLADPDITEIMVNGHSQIYIEKNGKLEMTDKTFMDDSSVLAVIERIVSPIGRRIDESQPYVDARLPDGSRVNAIIHPLSLIGPCLTIRKFSKIPFTDETLIRMGTMTSFMAEFIRVCVVLRKNIVVSGGTGSGKTSLLNVLSSYLPEDERIVTIEDAAELKLKQRHLVRLEARPPNIEGKGAITIRDLVRNALRMRPDRIVVGECRGGEALDMLQAMNTGHDGSLTTVHANSPRDVISRLETMVLMSGMELPVRAIREQVASAIDLIIHESRFSDGTRKITRITEVVGLEGDQITMQDIFEFKQTDIDENGKVVGHFRPTGSVPTFVEDVQSRGLTINRSMFDPQQGNGHG